MILYTQSQQNLKNTATSHQVTLTLFPRYPKWFKDYIKNDKWSFINCDIKEIYPSIAEKTVNEALNLAREYMLISEDKIKIIKHCRKSLLYNNEFF